MKKTVRNALLGCVVGAALAAAAPVVSASTVFAEFVVDEGSVPGAKNDTVTAARVVGNYSEYITFGSDSTFQVSLLWQAAQFIGSDGMTVSSQLGYGNKQYLLYALFQGNGTVSSLGGKTTFSFAPGGSLNVYLDPKSNTTFTSPESGAASYGRLNTRDDYLIATGTPASGFGNLDQTLSTCSADGSTGVNCGSFGTTTTFELTEAGKQYFISPKPFYDISFQSGQLDNFSQQGTQHISGSLDVVFNNAVPEPASVALLGLGFMGMVLGRRRKAKQA